MDNNVQQSVITQLRRRTEVVEVGPFVIGWDPANDSRYINYASPVLNAEIGPDDVTALIAAFREINRVPRLEYVVSSAPDLEGHLLAAGFTVEARHDYLVCTPESLVVPPSPEGVELAEPATDPERAAMIEAQHEAFGGQFTVSSADVDRIRRSQDNGAVVVLARAADGSIVGGGQGSAPADGLSEVAGIAVLEGFRRRGIAGAVTALITERLFAKGGTIAWLEASGDDSWRVYERVGYTPSGKRLYIALD